MLLLSAAMFALLGGADQALAGGKPDLIARSLKICYAGTANYARRGQTCPSWLTVKNQGSLAVSKRIAIDVTFKRTNGTNKYTLRRWVTVDLQPGRSQYGSFDLKLPAAMRVGTYRMSAKVDAGNAVIELNESNNDVLGPLVVVK
jgi:hypothetical protein